MYEVFRSIACRKAWGKYFGFSNETFNLQYPLPLTSICVRSRRIHLKLRKAPASGPALALQRPLERKAYPSRAKKHGFMIINLINDTASTLPWSLRFSVPQITEVIGEIEDTLRCVKSIPFYVEASKVFVTLAPTLRNMKGTLLQNARKTSLKRASGDLFGRFLIYSDARHGFFQFEVKFATTAPTSPEAPGWFNRWCHHELMQRHVQVGVGLRCGATSWQIHVVTWSYFRYFSDIGLNTKQFKSREDSITVMVFFICLLIKWLSDLGRVCSEVFECV